MAKKGRRCVVCGASHTTCAGPSGAIPIDRPERPTMSSRLRIYEVTINGHKTRLKLDPHDALQMYPDARPLHKARTQPAAVAPVPAPTPQPEPDAPVAADEPTAAAPKPLGGGWFMLSNGERVRGAEAARDAQAAL